MSPSTTTPASSSQPGSPEPSSQQSLWQLPVEATKAVFGHGRRAEALSLEAGQVPPNLSRWLLGSTAVLTGSILVSALVPIQDYVVASGEIEPAGDIQKVQHQSQVFFLFQ